MSNFYSEKPTIKEFIRYGKVRIVVFIYTTILGFMFIDLMGLKYWQFTLIFTPINFVVNYFMFKIVYHKQG